MDMNRNCYRRNINRNITNRYNRAGYNESCLHKTNSYKNSVAVSKSTDLGCTRYPYSYAERFFLRFVWKLIKVLSSDGFAAAFCGLTLLMIIGIVGGIECGRLSLVSGVIYSSVLLGVTSVLIYKKNRE